MNKEEKQVIEYFKNVVETQEFTHYEKVVLNLINKLQKENEELKEDNKNKDIEIATLLEEDNYNKEQLYKIKDILEELLEEELKL